jgi:hypothetical protein
MSGFQAWRFEPQELWEVVTYELEDALEKGIKPVVHYWHASVRTAGCLLKMGGVSVYTSRPRKLGLVFGDRRQILPDYIPGRLLNSRPLRDRSRIPRGGSLRRSTNNRYADNSLYIPGTLYNRFTDVLVANLASSPYHRGFDRRCDRFASDILSDIRLFINDLLKVHYTYRFVVDTIERPASPRSVPRTAY